MGRALVFAALALFVGAGAASPAAFAARTGGPAAFAARTGSAVPTVAFVQASSNAGEAAGLRQIEVRLSAAATTAVSVPVLASGSATLGVDYSLSPSPLVIPAGSLAGFVQVTLVSDTLHEAPELVVLDLGVPTGATLGAPTRHTLRIDDDDPAPVASFSVARSVVTEASGGFTVRVQLNVVSGRDAQLPFTITGPASGPGDIVAPASPAVILAGQTFVDLPVGLVVDRVAEAGESLTFRLIQPMRNAVPGAITTLLVAIDDGNAGPGVPVPPALMVTPDRLVFPQTSVGQSAGVRQLLVTNQHTTPLTFLGLAPDSGAVAGYIVRYPAGPPPIALAPGQSTTVDVELIPMTPGPRVAVFVVRQNFGGVPPRAVTFEGLALGPRGAEVVINAGGASYTQADRTFWSSDFGDTQSEGIIASYIDVLGTVDDALYHTSRWGQTVVYSFQVPNGLYEFSFRAWDPVQAAVGARVFDVSAEGALVFDDVDLVALVGTRTAWVSPKQRVQVSDGRFDVRFDASVARAIVSGLEVRSVPIVTTTTPQLLFGTVDQGSFGQRDVRLFNSGLAPGRVTSVQINPGVSGSASEFAVQVGSALHAGSATSATFPVDVVVPPGQAVLFPVLFTPVVHRDNDLTLRFSLLDADPIDVDVRGTGGANPGWGFLHPVIDHDPVVVIDYDGSGSELVDLLGSESHTHEVGRTLTGFEWRRNGQVVATTADATVNLPLGVSDIALTIRDDGVPQASATDSTQLTVYPANAVPGLLVRYYDGTLLGEVFLLDNVPQFANFVGRQTALRTVQVGNSVGNSSFTGDVMVRWSANFPLTAAATLTFTAQGGDGRRVLVDGQLLAGPVALATGNHSLEVRFAVSDVNDLPLTLSVTSAGLPVPLFESRLTHAEGALAPVIHGMPTHGIELGGNDIVIEGFGFFPKSQVVVNWGATPLTQAQFVAFSPERIHLLSPPGVGTVAVSVTTPNGTSNAVDYHYSPSGPVPVRWTLLSNLQFIMNDPTRGAWGPDGRLWVAARDGTLRAFTYGDDWQVLSVEALGGVSALTNRDVLGLTFNPFDVYDPLVPSSLKVYVAHGELYQNGGGAFNDPSEFTGQVSVLTYPHYDTPVPLVYGLPVSNHDHSINGIEFDANGDLLICCGGNTNAGVDSLLMGDVPESPFSGALLKAHTSRPAFQGNAQILDRQTLQVVQDQRYGQNCISAPGIDIEVFAHGLRNPFDLVLHTNGYIYATDNGPNDPFGPASTGLTTNAGVPHPFDPDELLLIDRGDYYGHPNRARGQDDLRQAIHHGVAAPSLAHEFTQCILQLDSSTNGIEEYRATAFNSGIRGQLVVMKLNQGVRLVELDATGRAPVGTFAVPQSPVNSGLDVAAAPGGALIAIDYTLDRVRVQVPDDIAAVGLTAYDVFPRRAPSGGGAPFIIGGQGFGSLASTSVTFGGIPAVLTSVTSKRIKGRIPAQAIVRQSFVDVVVQSAASAATIPQGFQYLAPAPGQAHGFWRASAALPVALGEVACAEVGGKLYVFGQGDARTFRYDALNNTWSTTLAQRPFAGNHHGCEVWNGRVYLIGGLDSASGGRVQIYDPASDTWSLGAPMPWAGGSVVTGLINDRIYVGGGIVGASTVGNFAVYDPALDTWASLGALPTPVNHAAVATDGDRLYIFGGRQGPNIPQPGFASVQVYNPVTNTWRTSQAGQVAPMPLPRGGTGRAVWYRDEFFVFGGEDNSVAFAEVQAYDPATNAWRRDASMPIARHGIFPVLFQDRVFVFGGGTNAGFGSSTLAEVFKRP